MSFTADKNFVYLQTRTKEMIDKQQPVRTYLHRLGDDTKKDKFLIAPEDAKDYASVWDAYDDSVTFYTIGDFYSNTLKMKKQGSGDEPTVIYSSKLFQATNIKVRNQKIFILTNDHSPNFKILVADIHNPDFSQWKEFYGEKESVLSDFTLAKNYVIIKDRKDIMTRLFAYSYDGKEIKSIELPEFGYISRMDYHKPGDATYITISTFTSLAKVYKLDCKSLTWSLFYEEQSPVELNDIESRLVFYPSHDGKKIPMFLVHKKGIVLNGNNPAYLWAYGGFNIGISPKYLGSIIPFILRGGVYALAGLRGGDEYGENWHRDGMLNNKQNVFNDYFSAAEFLIREKYTNSSRLAAEGRSNGGLLMGAVLTQRPDLFKVAVCGVPLLDMVRYHKFLIARYWIPEYGDPDKKEDFLNILNYSPYHNIRSGFNLPTTMVIAGENDTRVDPLHAKKFVAALQNNPSQINPILLFMDYDSGHGSGASVEKQIYNAEIRWRFIMRELGM
ncbi:MAG: hypothetical protein A3H98_05575 [Bacteroidetes bacterium RIFCSPLOWO2_02_FULL_36_8]|nr:MAG: hypothetical protein A3H98_05575 [Bacteroidetes bacterium RIFCSPLOWO2_02_FULL_36_8]